MDDNKSPSFGLNVSFVGSCENYIKIGICLNYLPKSKDDTSSNMVVVEIQLPSGYVSDRDDAKSEDISVSYFSMWMRTYFYVNVFIAN